jgi:phosphoglycolate phosphatase-like HAD superfamily hydrolase
MSRDESNWLRILNPAVQGWLGNVRHVVFDFDGTLSVLRQGWEPVMEQVMLKSICPEGDSLEAMVNEVRNFIDISTGQLTIVQMRWLVEAVQRWSASKTSLTAQEYKARYLDALMISVSQRLESLERGVACAEDYLIVGSIEFLQGLSKRGVQLYIASGSDHPDVEREAGALGIIPYITGGIYGALDTNEENAKDRVIQRILDEHRLSGKELLVIGDGPVEIIEAMKRGAIALGVASNEVARQGWNDHKVARLSRTGADLLVADYRHAAQLIRLLVH